MSERTGEGTSQIFICKKPILPFPAWTKPLLRYKPFCGASSPELRTQERCIGSELFGFYFLVLPFVLGTSNSTSTISGLHCNLFVIPSQSEPSRPALSYTEDDPAISTPYLFDSRQITVTPSLKLCGRTLRLERNAGMTCGFSWSPQAEDRRKGESWIARPLTNCRCRQDVMPGNWEEMGGDVACAASWGVRRRAMNAIAIIVSQYSSSETAIWKEIYRGRNHDLHCQIVDILTGLLVGRASKLVVEHIGLVSLLF